MSDARERILSALRSGDGLQNDFTYYISWEDYTSFPDPLPRTRFEVKEVQEAVRRYSNPEKPDELFRWDIHGRLLMPETVAMPGVAVVMIHGGAANECEFVFVPDGPEEYVDLTMTSPTQARVGVAQHIASLGFPVLAISLPGHYSPRPWPPIPERQPEFVIGEVPTPKEIANRLAVYTFRMCVEAVKVLIERSLPGYAIHLWGHSTGGEYLYLMEQYGLRNKLLGGLGFGTGCPASLHKEWDLLYQTHSPEERAQKYAAIAGLMRRSPQAYEQMRYTGPNQPWGSAERWFELENHRRPQFKPFLQDIEHLSHDALYERVKEVSGLTDEEIFITYRPDLGRLRGKKLLFFVGENDRGHWIDGGESGVESRLEVFTLRKLAAYADEVRLVVIPRISHYGHVESHNERLANLMVTGIKDYLPLPLG
jgi:pimeloyl-ACP methyl ester carboxylesterase